VKSSTNTQVASRERSNSDLLGHELVGAGPTRVLITNDWLCDTSTWDTARTYLNRERFTFAFADLRGYGRSRGRSGAFTVSEAASDVLALADALGWARFASVGHSMSALVTLQLAQHHADRIDRAVVLTPPPPTGFGADEEMIAASRGLALADDATRLKVLEQRFGTRLSAGWTSYKLSQWRVHADPVAAASYVRMFAGDGLPDPTARIAIPVLAITGEQDVPPMRSDAVKLSLDPLCSELTVTALADSGHYPMQEMPPLTVALVERFLGG
jgi:3-oxoadipate enol-lactonase